MAIKTALGAQRYNNRMNRIFEDGRRNKMEAAFLVMLTALKTTLEDCEMALNGTWDKSDEGFEATASMLREVISQAEGV